MIDDDFSPDRVQIEALGMLFIAAMRNPCFPVLSERLIYKNFSVDSQEKRPSWFSSLLNKNLISFANRSHEKELIPYKGGAHADGVSLTPAGTFYCISHWIELSEQQYGLTRDLDGEPLGLMYHIAQEYGSRNEQLLQEKPYFTANKSSTDYNHFIDSLDDVLEAIAKDNELAAIDPNERDKLVNELRELREAIENGKFSPSRITIMGWGTFAYLSTKFADKPIGHLAEIAWQALQTLIGI